MKSTSVFLFTRPFHVILLLGLLAQLLAGCSANNTTPAAYPNPSTSTPFLLPTSTFTISPLPTSTFTPFPLPSPSFTPFKEDFKVQGRGDFPRLAVIATASDHKTLALYWVQTDTASQLRVFAGTNRGNDRVSAQLSPDGRRVASLLRTGNGTTLLEINGIDETGSYLIAQGIGKLNPQDKGSGFEEITSAAWLDDGQLVYSKDTSPRKKEIWISSVDGKEQHLLSTVPIQRVLGGSPDGKTLYVTRLIPEFEGWRMEGFALLDIASGRLEALWPPEEQAGSTYYSFQLIRLPNGAARILFVDGRQGPGTTTAMKPPIIWIGDPETRQAKAVWTVNHSHTENIKGRLDTTYDFPEEFLWSPDSENEFIYYSSGTMWKVNLLGPTERRLVEKGGLRLQAWTPEGITRRKGIRTPEGIIVSDDLTGILQMLDRFGVLQGEIALGYIHPR